MKQPPMPTKVQAEILQKLVDGWVIEFSLFRTALINPNLWSDPVWRNISGRTMGVLNMNAWVTQSGETGAITEAGREALARYYQKEARRANR